MIGVVGLGRMGRPLALSLVGKGADVVGWDSSAAACQAASDDGLAVAPDLMALSRCGQVILSLPSSEAVSSVLLSREGLVEVVAEGSLFIDTSTTDHETALSLERTCNEAGRWYVDAPVSGGPASAAAGSLVAMVGGSERAVHLAQQTLSLVCEDVIHVGEAGSGQAAKLCHQLMAFGEVALFAEAMTVAEAAGVPRSVFARVAAKGAAGSAIVQTYASKVAAGSGPTTYTVHEAHEELSAFLRLSDKHDCRGLAARAVHAAFAQAATVGAGAADLIAVAEAAADGRPRLEP